MPESRLPFCRAPRNCGSHFFDEFCATAGPEASLPARPSCCTVHAWWAARYKNVTGARYRMFTFRKLFGMLMFTHLAGEGAAVRLRIPLKPKGLRSRNAGRPATEACPNKFVQAWYGGCYVRNGSSCFASGYRIAATVVSGITKYLMGAAALAIVLVAEPSAAAIVVPQSFDAEGPAYGEAMESLWSDMADLGAACAGAPPLVVIPIEQEEEYDRPELPGIFANAGAACEPPSTSLSTGSGGSGAAILNAADPLEPSSLESALAGDPPIVLPAGPPFELLRPV